MTGSGAATPHDALAARFPATPALVDDRESDGSALHLYHAANSICSQKVRAVLAAQDQPYASHLMQIFKGDTYDPAYVRLRMTGGQAAGLRMVDEHPGSTSVEATGFDACVVPTIYDDRTGEILVDSRRICIELDRRAGGTLMPDDLRESILAEIDLIDNLPNYQLLAVAVGKPSPDAPDNAFAVSKVARCDALLAEHGDDPLLRAGYEAKRRKEQDAAGRLFGAEAMGIAAEAIARAVRDLDARLADSGGPFLFGDRLTLADLFWGVELIRADDLGFSHIWADGACPAVQDYYRTLASHPSMQHALADWPGARLNAPHPGHGKATA